MVGAVLQQEWLLGSRLHVFRWIYAGWPIALVVYSFLLHVHDEHKRLYSRVVAGLLLAIDKQLGTQLSVAAGSFSIDHRVFTILTCLGLALLFWSMSRLFLGWAMRWVADRERTRHWYEEPIYRRSRRQPAKMTR